MKTPEQNEAIFLDIVQRLSRSLDTCNVASRTRRDAILWAWETIQDLRRKEAALLALGGRPPAEEGVKPLELRPRR